MNDYYIIIRPLLEKYMMNAKEGEIILDKKTGHLTIKHNGKFISKTKELEARINALLGWKNELVKQFIDLSNRIDILVNELDKLKDRTNQLNETIQKLMNELAELEIQLNLYLSQVDEFCRQIKIFQYQTTKPYLDAIVANLRNLIRLTFVIRESNFLLSDIREQKISNSTADYQIV